MTPLLNDLVARAVRGALPLASALARRDMAKRIARFERDQAELRARYGVERDTPIRGYDDITRAAVHALARTLPDARLATTSGSTGAPKELLYTRDRLRSYKRDSISGAVRAFVHYRVRRPSMFILASLKEDDSFASLVLHGRGARPPWLAGLVEPSRWLAHPALARVVAEHGATAARLWLMIVADPGMLYATNPSTIVAFFGEVHERWPAVRAALTTLADVDATDARLRDVVQSVGARGWRERVARAAASSSAPPVDALLPSLTAYCTWDGGYVTAFLPALHRFLPPERYAHLPMYSMSTETIETLTWFDDDGAARFLPLGPGVLYELLPEDAPDTPAHLLSPTAAQPGHTYSLVVSDAWGLKRYQTDDLFRCEALVRGLPDLRFQRRRGLAYSFTGEKLTGEQLALAYDELRARFPALAGVELVCFPSQPASDAVPFYRLVVVPTSTPSPSDAVPAGAAPDVDVDVDAVARALDEALIARNAELANKRASGRLGAVRASVIPHDTLARALDRRTTTDDDVKQRAWESQFKLAPLMKKRWEDVGL